MDPDSTILQQAYDLLEPRLRQIPDEKVITPRLRLKQCAAAVLAVAEVARGSVWKPRFEAFAKAGVWDIENLDLLEPAARAVWYVRYVLDNEVKKASQPHLLQNVAREATELRNSMRSLCEFVLADDPEIAPRLANLRPGTGYADLADDLIGYADIYRKRASRLAVVPTFYKPDDATKAVEYAETIMRLTARSRPSDTALWVDMAARAFTFLSQVYEEVRSAALYIGRADPETRKQFPSLVTMTRSKRQPRTAKEPQAPEPTPES